MQGGKKGRGPKASARGGASPADPNKERLMYMLTCLHGHLVTVKMNNGQMWEGNFHSCSSEGDISITLKSARQVPTGRGKSGETNETMVIHGKDFAQVSARNIPHVESKNSATAFKTDAEIAESWGQSENRELMPWSAGSGAQSKDVSMELGSTRQIGTWDQFERNQQMFGITSTYSEDYYTTKLDPSKIPEHKRKDAERIAREIESGQNYSRIEEGVADDVDEEAQFSAVGPHRDPIHAPLTMENVSQHDAASAELHGDGFAREHRAKRYMITAHSTRMPQLSEMKSINALNLEPALPKFDDKTRSDWINFKQSHTRQGPGNVGREELQQSFQAIPQREGNGKKPTAQSTVSSGGQGNHREGAPAEESKGDGSSKFSFNPSAKEFSFNPQATAFTPTGGSSSTRNGDKPQSSGSKKDTGGDKNSAMAPGPLQNARASGATKSFLDFLKPVKTGAKKQTLDDLLGKLLTKCHNPENCSPKWDSASGPSYKEILGQPTAGNPAALQLQQQMLQSTQMKQMSNQNQQNQQQNQQSNQQSQQQNQQMQQMHQMQQMQSQQNTQQSQQGQQPSQQQMGMQMMQPQGGFIMAVPGCGNQQMLQQQMFQQMPQGAGRGNNSQGQGMQSQQQPQMMGQSGQNQQQMGGCPQNMMGGQFVALQGNMNQGGVGMTGMVPPKFGGAQMVPMMVPAGQFPQGFMPQGMQGGNMQGMQPQMGDGMMPQMQNQMMQQGPMQGCGYRGMGGPSE